MRYVFMVNPAAGKGKKYQDLIESINTYFKTHNGEYKIIVSKQAGDIKAAAKTEAEIGDEVLFLACGGEGTFFEALNGAIEYDNAYFAVIPIGSANDFLKSFGAENKKLFMDIGELIEGSTVKMDAIKADEFYCINGCSVGMDAMVGRDMILYKNWPFVSGPMAYKLAIVKTFLSKIGVNLEIVIDGVKKLRKNCLFMVVGNGPVYGGGYMGTPKALPYDGILNYTVVDTISRLRILLFLKKYENGKHENLSCCTMGECSEISFKSDKAIPINLDGEIVERKEMHFTILKDKIKFRLPSSVANKIKKTATAFS